MKNLNDKITSTILKDGSLDLSFEEQESLKNLDGLANCTTLKTVELECPNLENVDGLAE